MSEVNEYIAKAEDKLEVCKILIDAGQYASSVSASYYSMFLTAKALLIKKGFKPKTHNGVISLFGQEYVLNDNFSGGISKYLSSAQSLRESADYDAYDGIDESMANDCFNKAELFMKEAEKFL